MRRIFLTGLTFIALAAASLDVAADGASGANTEDDALPHKHAEQISLPSQPLAEALVTYARLINQTLMYDPQLVGHYQAPALKNPATYEAGLHRLLANSPLQARRIAQGWAIVHKPARDEPSIHTATEQVPPVMEEMTVTASYGESLNRARMEKRFAPQAKEVVMATDIAEFPALNIADALSRTPGVSLERDRGEALFVSIRGLPTQFNTLSVNGLPIAANENVRTSEQYGRRFHYDTLPAELVAGVEVKKTAMASDLAGAIGGSVNISTYRPLAWGKKQFVVKAMTSNSPLANSTDPRLSVLGNWLNFEKTFGIMVAATHAQRHVRQDRVLTFDWATGDGESYGLSDNIYYPPNIRPTQEQEERNRVGVSTAFDWQPSSQHHFTLTYLGLNQHIEYDEYSYSADYSLTGLTQGSVIWDEASLVGGHSETGSVQISRETAGLKDTSHSIVLHHDWQQKDWEWQSQFGLSVATSKNDDPIKRTRLRRNNDVSLAFRYDDKIESGLPMISYQNIRLTDATDFPGRRLEWRVNSTRDSQHFANFSGMKNIQWAQFTSLETGIFIQRHERKYSRRDFLFSNNFAGEYFTQSHFFITNDDFLGHTAHQVPTRWLVPHQSSFWATIDDQMLLATTPFNSDLLNSYSVAENTSSGFVQLNFDHATMWGNLGLRVVNTSQTSSGYFEEDSEQPSLTPVSFSSDYYHFLPAVNVNVSLTPQWQLRGGFSRALSRPDLPDLAPRLTLNSGDSLTATGGNPYLQPIQAWQFDLSIERYSEPLGVLAISAFYKKLDSFIQYQQSRLVVNQKSYLLESKTNGGEASVYGMEFIYQGAFNPLNIPDHELGGNFNLTVTGSDATYQHADVRWHDALEGVATRTFNAELYYKAPRWAVRANYNWTSDILEQTELSDSPARYSAPFGALSLHASYQLTPQLALFVEGTNLLDEAEKEYVLNNYIANYTYYGRLYSVGVRLML